jgi:20S proteasome alpha/beta subunit
MPWTIMTLAIGIRADQAIVLVADGRLSTVAMGSLIVESDAICKLHDFGRFGVATAGSQGAIDRIVSLLRESKALESAADIKHARNAASRVIRADYREQEWNWMKPEDWPPVALLIAGYSIEGTQILSRLHSKKGLEISTDRNDFVGTEFGCTVARVLNRLFLDDLGMTTPSLEDAQRFGVMAVQIVKEFDCSVGGLIRMAVVTPDGYRDVSDDVPRFEKSAKEIRAMVQKTPWST